MRSLLTLLLAAPAFALAQAATPPAATPPPPPPPARGPALALANEAAQAAIDACRAKGFNVSVSVVDSAGVLKALLAADGAHERGVNSSTAKARTSLNFRQPTSAVGKRASEDAAFDAQLKGNPAWNGRAGGLPVLVGGQLIGAIGVGGARGSENDEACAQAGLAQVQARLQ
ncbi:MAG TPA: heme-binding protein [Pseudoduganella sp.]|jgi:uncharacterized protein GlcG (DUF336 family)